MVGSYPSRYSLTRRNLLAAAGAGAAIKTLGFSVPAKAAQKKGGHFRTALTGASTSNSADPRIITGSVFMQSFSWGFRNNLTLLDAYDKLQPELAEGWDVTPDAKRWTFKLRKGVEFHSGKKLTSADIVASINLHRGETTSPAKSLFRTVEKIVADDANTVTFYLTEGNADFALYLSSYNVPIVPEKDGVANWQAKDGTGGYKLERFEPGVKAEFRRNPNYFKADAAFFDTIELLGISDLTARMEALRTGNVHAVDRVGPRIASRLAQTPNVVIKEIQGGRHFVWPMRCDVPPFNDVNVRQAFKYAINREELLQKILLGHGSVGNDNPITPIQPFFNSNIPQTKYDPEKAKFLLKKAGLSTVSVDLSAADVVYEGAVDSAVLFKESAAPAGINVNVIREPNDGYFENVWLKKPFCLNYSTTRDTEDWTFSLWYVTGAAWNDSNWSNPHFDDLLLKARSELDQNKRRQIYYEMQQLVHDESGNIIPLFASYITGVNKSVSLPEKISASRDMDGARFLERWSFA